MDDKRKITVYVLLAAAWAVVCAWQTLEHRHVRENARDALVNRARDISNSLGVVIRSQRRFGVLPAGPLESALRELAESKELLSIALLNAAGEVVTSAGEEISLQMEDLQAQGERWGDKSVTFVNLVDLGGGPDDRLTSEPAPIVLPRREEMTSETARTFPQRFGGPTTETLAAMRQRTPEWEARRGDREPFRPPEMGPGEPSGEGRRGDREPFHRSRRDRPFRRPPWLSEEEYQNLLKKQGLHGFVLRMSTDVYRSECARDFWMRITVAAVSWVAVLGLGLAWRSVDRSNRLQMRLLRASELNTHLQEMNIAAAGLAHETRNPLNVVRGLAQMLARDSSASEDMRNKSREISEEVDRVTGRLNEFINYSKPLQPRQTPTNLQAVVRDVVRAMESDMEDKAVRFEMKGPDVTVAADESLLRQVVFNLMMNAVQAVGREGKVEVCIENGSGGEVSLEVRDDGPGVPEDLRKDVFRPYFTTRKQGSGLGLAVVHQIVLAHQWEMDYVPGQNGGAVFRVTGLKVA